MSITIRNSSPGDIAAIAQIYAHHVMHGTATFELTPPKGDEMARRRVAVLGEGLPFLVAERGGAIAGYAYAGLYRPRPAYRFTVEDSIYLHPDHLRKGIGRQLLTELVARCETGRLRQMVAVIGDSANTGSIRVHELLGFRHVGVFQGVGWKFGRWLDTVLMQRSLGSGDQSEPTAVV
jgi:L-amino acid N-acyltransferase YncA